MKKQAGNTITMVSGSNNGTGGNNTKRKQFKNMFYSPKNNREAYTEPHSKIVSQV